MKWRLLLCKWSADYDSPAKRKKAKLRFSEITAQFVATGSHPAIGPVNIDAFMEALDDTFGHSDDQRHFHVRAHRNCAVIEYSDNVRIALVPKLASVGKQFELNASEFRPTT